MSDVVRIDSPDDPRLRDFADLTDVQLRSRREPAEGLFIAEGELVIHRALAAGHQMRSMVLSEKWLPTMAPLAERAGAPVYVLPVATLEQLTGFHVHRGALASMVRLPERSASEVLSCARHVAVLEDVNTHTNVGAIFRGAAALGLDAVLLSPRCADPLYRRSVRVSMGSVFSVPWARVQPWPAALETLREHGLRLLALTPAPSAVPLPELSPTDTERCALLLGSEGDGLSRDALAAADLQVRIPMSPEVDSLNVAAAAAVAFYAVTQVPRS